jgi:vacuolar iron transporter family protein
MYSLGSSKLVITGGLAELFSGSISMGLGAYLAAVTDKDHYDAREKREKEEIIANRRGEEEVVYTIMREYGVDREATRPLLEALQKNEVMWIKATRPFHS